jgi:hypothetical protein
VVLNPVRAKTVRHPRQWKWSSYGATAVIVHPHGCLTVDEILSHFDQRKVNAQEKYLFRPESNPSISDDLEAQSLFGSRRVCGGTPTPGDRKAIDSGDTEGATIRGATEFREAIFT